MLKSRLQLPKTIKHMPETPGTPEKYKKFTDLNTEIKEVVEKPVTDEELEAWKALQLAKRQRDPLGAASEGRPPELETTDDTTAKLDEGSHVDQSLDTEDAQAIENKLETNKKLRELIDELGNATSVESFARTIKEKIGSLNFSKDEFLQKLLNLANKFEAFSQEHKGKYYAPYQIKELRNAFNEETNYFTVLKDARLSEAKPAQRIFDSAAVLLRDHLEAGSKTFTTDSLTWMLWGEKTPEDQDKQLENYKTEKEREDERIKKYEAAITSERTTDYILLDSLQALTDRSNPLKGKFEVPVTKANELGITTVRVETSTAPDLSTTFLFTIIIPPEKLEKFKDKFYQINMMDYSDAARNLTRATAEREVVVKIRNSTLKLKGNTLSASTKDYPAEIGQITGINVA